MALTYSLLVLFIAVLLQIFRRNFYSNASCFSLLWLYLGITWAIVRWALIGPLVLLWFNVPAPLPPPPQKKKQQTTTTKNTHTLYIQDWKEWGTMRFHNFPCNGHVLWMEIFGHLLGILPVTIFYIQKKERKSEKKKVNSALIKMSLLVRKPVFGVSDQVRQKPGSTATEDSLMLEILYIGSRWIVLSV